MAASKNGIEFISQRSIGLTKKTVAVVLFASLNLS